MISKRVFLAKSTIHLSFSQNGSKRRFFNNQKNKMWTLRRKMMNFIIHKNLLLRFSRVCLSEEKRMFLFEKNATPLTVLENAPPKSSETPKRVLWKQHAVAIMMKFWTLKTLKLSTLWMKITIKSVSCNSYHTG